MCAFLGLFFLPSIQQTSFQLVFCITFTSFCLSFISLVKQTLMTNLARYSIGLSTAGIYLQAAYEHESALSMWMLGIVITMGLLLANDGAVNQSKRQFQLRIVGFLVLVAAYLVPQLPIFIDQLVQEASLGLILLSGIILIGVENQQTKVETRVGSDDVVRIGSYQDTKNHWYYSLITSSWIGLSVKLILGYLFCCVFFSVLFMFDTNGLNTDLTWTKSLAFSVQTFSTIGYGALYPSSDFSHTIVFIESFVGIVYTAVITGLIFTKVSLPASKILFSKQVIFLTYNKKPTISFRLANAKGANIVDAKVGLYLLCREVNEEGVNLNRIHDLKLVRDHSPLFALSWNLFHSIDESSPLFGMTKKEIEEKVIYFIVTVQGHERLYNQQIYDRYTYEPQSWEWDRKFVDVIDNNESNQVILSLIHFHDTVPSTSNYWLSEQE